MDKPPPPREVFTLYRDGKFYAQTDDREQLISIVHANPDFTSRNADGSEPKAALVRYVVADVINL